MKKKLFLTGVLALMVAGGIFWSCQKEEFHSDDLNLKNGTVSDCVDEVTPAVQDVTGGGKVPAKIGEIKIWNDNEMVYVSIGTFTYEGIKMVGFLDSDAIEPGNPVYNQNAITLTGGVISYEIPEGWDFCTAKRFWIKIEGKPGGTESYAINYELQEICEGCKESFTYVDNQDGTITFKYTPETDMTDVNVVFTFPQVEYITFLSGYEYSSFVRPGNGNAQNMQARLSFTACQEYTWTVQLVDCTAANQTANGWTDFTVNETSLKNVLTPNFTYNCPVD